MRETAGKSSPGAPTRPHTHVSSSVSRLMRLAYGCTRSLNPGMTAPQPPPNAAAARTWLATVAAGNPWPRKMTRL